MKKEQQFHVNDKVFAKVKGYPPWPAVILEDNGKKYKVKFYGTGEIGQIKSEDLFYYARNKNRLLKPTKRKDFNDSVKEIELAISEAGTDGDPYYGTDKGKDSVLNDSSTIIDSESSFTKKRKRSVSIHKLAEDSAMNKAKKGKVASVTSSDTSPVNQEKTASPEESKLIKKKKFEESKSIEQPDPKELEEKKIVEVVDDVSITESAKTVENDIIFEESVIEESEEGKKPAYKDFVMERELDAFIAYGDYVEKHRNIYLKMPIEKRNYSKLQVLPIFTEDECIGIKLHEKWPLNIFNNEYENAVYDKQASQRVLKLKKSFDLDSLKNSPNMYCKGLEVNKNEMKKLWEKKLLTFKENIMEYVKIECKLLAIDAKIKSCLNLDKADPKEAISLLNKLFDLNVSAVMLKKHAHVVDMVRRLKKYVGNLESWNLTKEETDSFKEDAEKVRECALKLHVKFIKVVGSPQLNESFWDHFNDITTKFREETKDLDEMEFYLLFTWPYSRQNFFNSYFIKDISVTIPSNIDMTVSDSEGV